MAPSKMPNGKKKKDERLVKIGELIQERRKIIGLTQEELAEASDASASTIKAIEQGERTTSIEVVVKISEKLNISLDVMLEPLKTIKTDVSEGRKSVELCMADKYTRERLVEYANLMIAANCLGNGRKKKK